MECDGFVCRVAPRKTPQCALNISSWSCLFVLFFLFFFSVQFIFASPCSLLFCFLPTSSISTAKDRTTTPWTQSNGALRFAHRFDSSFSLLFLSLSLCLSVSLSLFLASFHFNPHVLFSVWSRQCSRAHQPTSRACLCSPRCFCNYVTQPTPIKTTTLADDAEPSNL